jgi:ATP-dependent RNA helicase RhlE
MMKFNELSLDPIILKNLENKGYETPTPIQEQSIPHLLQGLDLLGIAQTGTGKTAAFSLPIIDKLIKKNEHTVKNKPTVLILTPTRELASQIKENIQTYSQGSKIKSGVIFGGVGQAAQIQELRQGLDILIATPGRLLDLIGQGYLSLELINIFVLDEADRMLDMGFIHDVKKVLKLLPQEKQSLLFSATMPDEIVRVASNFLKNPKKVEVTPQSTTVEKIDQKIIFVAKKEKYQLLRKMIEKMDSDLMIVFTRTKHGANHIVEYLSQYKISSAAIHGNKSQNAREAALSQFKSGKIKVLIATDIAARGIDIKGIGQVVNFDLPVDAESYVHRIGRTARAGAEGEATSFCDETERDALSRIQKLIKMKILTENYVGEKEPAFKPAKPQRPLRKKVEPMTNNRNNQDKKVGFKFRKKR